MADTIKNRYDFAFLFDIKDGNPNGDPDAGNLPRVDAETGQGIVTDVCLKRKVRNYVQIKGQEIFVREKGILNQFIEQAYATLGTDLGNPPANEKDGKKRNEKGVGQGSEVESARQQMCRNFYDIRCFGAVMSVGANAGQVRGPIQLTFARSVDPVVVSEHCITRMAVTTEAEAEKQSGGNRTMGRKSTIPYGLYVAHGFVSANLASQTGFSEADLELFWEALLQMFEHDRSAARGLMSPQKLVVFKHDSALGNKPAHELFKRVAVERIDPLKPARDFSDYKVTVDKASLEGVKIIEKL